LRKDRPGSGERPNHALKTWLDLVTTIFIVVGGVLALLQLHQTHKQRARESALQMLHSFQTRSFLSAVNIVFELPPWAQQEGDRGTPR
jgi:hypothetical protein